MQGDTETFSGIEGLPGVTWWDLEAFSLRVSGGFVGEKASFPAHLYLCHACHPFDDLCTLEMLRTGVSVTGRQTR